MVDAPQARMVDLHLHAVELAIATLGEPLVHARGLVGKVEDFCGCDSIATDRTGTVEEGGDETIALAILVMIDGELGIDL